MDTIPSSLGAIEQKNWVTVRTLATTAMRAAALLEMQRLYQILQILAAYFNHFQPFRKIVDKTRHGAALPSGSMRRPRRIVACSPAAASRASTAKHGSYRSLSPITLRRQIEERR